MCDNDGVASSTAGCFLRDQLQSRNPDVQSGQFHLPQLHSSDDCRCFNNTENTSS